MSEWLDIRLEVDIPPGIHHIADEYLIGMYSAQDKAAEEFLEAYQLQVIVVDALASHEFYDTIEIRETEGLPGGIRGKEVSSPTIQAYTMEVGRPAGLKPPPAAVIYQWMHYKAMEPSWSGAYAIANAIAKRGIKGRHPAERAFMIAEPRVLEIFESNVAQVTREMNR